MAPDEPVQPDVDDPEEPAATGEAEATPTSAVAVDAAEASTGRSGLDWAGAVVFLQRYAVLIMIVILMAALSFASDAFLTVTNLLNILNQSAPLAIVACAVTLVVIGGGFDLSTGPIFGVAAVVSAWMAVNVDPYLAIAAAAAVGLSLGIVNGLIITGLKIHSFLATLATGLVYRGLALLITGGFFITISGVDEFLALGRMRIGPVRLPVLILVAFALLIGVVLNRTTLGRYIFAVGGNEEAARLSGVRVNLVKISTFAFSGLAAGLAGAILAARIGSGQPEAGFLLELNAIAAVILGGTSIYGGSGAVWRSVAGVYLIALINNGFNILDANPFFRDLTTGVIIVLAVAISAADAKRR